MSCEWYTLVILIDFGSRRLRCRLPNPVAGADRCIYLFGVSQVRDLRGRKPHTLRDGACGPEEGHRSPPLSVPWTCEQEVTDPERITGLI
jgi:hypothetical protein